MRIESDALAGRWKQLPRAVFRITGPDRARYLNGQVSNDITGAIDREAVAACLCNAKGKVEALVWVQSDEEGLIVDGELSQRDFLLARLEKYLISDDCEVTDVTETLTLVHVFDEGVTAPKAARLGPDSSAGRDLWRGTADGTWEKEGAIDDDEWETLEILGGVPRHPHEIDGENLPAELGLDTWAVSFTKGCYLGQEVVSRMRSAGKLRRKLTVVESERPLAAGQRVETEQKKSGSTTRSSQSLGQKKHLALAMLAEARGKEKPVGDQRVVREIERRRN